MAKVTLENVVKHFAEIVAVEHMDLEIEDKEFVVLAEIIEPMGDTVVLNVNASDNELVACTTPSTKALRGQKLFLGANLDNMHLFDLRKEEAII